MTSSDSLDPYEQVQASLLRRWPESRLEPSLDRIGDLVELLGEPQRSFEVIHLTGTNGKTSTARMIESLLRARGLRTGRFTSPHLETMRERISIDGEPLSPENFAKIYHDISPYAHVLDERSEHPLSFFEMTVGMAFAAFSDAPVDVAVVEVGLGGTWDATNVADGQVAVITPIAVDHARYLGDRPADIAVEKAGIIKPGARVVCAEQSDEVLAVIVERCREVGADLRVAGVDFGVISAVPGLGGQMLTLAGLYGEYREIFLPLYGSHQASNAALALAAVEAWGSEPDPGTGQVVPAGAWALSEDVVREAFVETTSPGRLEIIRRGPTVLLDAAHNPHGAAALAEALHEFFTFDPLIAVVAVMSDKDAEGLLSALEPLCTEIICTQNSSPRCLDAQDLAVVAADIFGEHRVAWWPRLDDAIEAAVTAAETGGALGESMGSGGVLVTGSVVTVGEARTLLARAKKGN